jgi:hypothetical protein
MMLLLHKEATFHNYHYFLSHISAKLASSISYIDVILPTQIEVGSDDEKALTKAIDVVFLNSKRSLCTKHLKDNITDYLKNKFGINTKDLIHLIDLIFGEQGILNSGDTFQFEERCSQLLTNANTPNFNNYFERTLKLKLKLNYKNLGREGLNTSNRWTNNNAESINNIMKLDANWKPHSTPALINLLADMIKPQQLDLKRALYNSGNYRLFELNKTFCIREDKCVITHSKQRLCNINRWNLLSHQQSRWGCEETRAKEATSQCKDIQKTLNEKNLCYFVSSEQ